MGHPIHTDTRCHALYLVTMLQHAESCLRGQCSNIGLGCRPSAHAYVSASSPLPAIRVAVTAALQAGWGTNGTRAAGGRAAKPGQTSAPGRRPGKPTGHWAKFLQPCVHEKELREIIRDCLINLLLVCTDVTRTTPPLHDHMQAFRQPRCCMIIGIISYISGACPHECVLTRAC